MEDTCRKPLTNGEQAMVSDSETSSSLFNRERRENTRKRCAQLAISNEQWKRVRELRELRERKRRLQLAIRNCNGGQRVALPMSNYQ
jgi:hypothetical protein